MTWLRYRTFITKPGADDLKQKRMCVHVRGNKKSYTKNWRASTNYVASQKFISEF